MGLFENFLKNTKKENSDNLNEDKSSTAKIKTFKDLENAINSGASEINLDGDITFDSSDSPYDVGIAINSDNLVINGNGNTINAKSKTPIFKVNANNVILKDIFFESGNSGHIGGAIFNEGKSLKISDCTFRNNNAGYAGGAICNNQGSIDILDSSFEDNSAVKSAGAIRNDEGEIKVEGCTFSRNKTSEYGAAIYNWHSKLDVIECNFDNNVADKFSGGAIRDDDGFMKIYDCNFTSNAARGGGGAILISSTDCEIINCAFAKSISGHGGAIFNISSNLKLNGCLFRENFAKEFGGAIGSESGDNNIINSRFWDNKAQTNSGGAIYNNSESSLILYNTVFENNSAKGLAGVLFNYNKSKAKITECIFNDNFASVGGVLVTTADCEMEIESGFFNSNSSDDMGGAIFSEGPLNITKSKFSKNKTEKAGGAIYGNQSSVLKIEASVFNSNESNIMGGAIVSDNDIELLNCRICKNTAKSAGGGLIILENSSYATMSSFEDNSPDDFTQYR